MLRLASSARASSLLGWFLRGCLVLLFCSSVIGQELSVPANGIYDDTRFFNDTQSAKVQEILQQFQADGISTYIYTTTFVMGGVQKKATDLENAWVGDKPGLVFAYSRGEPTPSLVFSEAFWLQYPTEGVMELFNLAAKAWTESSSEKEEARAILLLTRLQAAVHRLEEDRSRRNHLVAYQKEFSVVVLFAVGLAALATGGWWLGRISRRNLQNRREKHYFPDVEVEARLGAPYGGGTVAETITRGTPTGKS